MSLPRNVAEVISEHVTLELECIDRMYLNLYQPMLQAGGGAAILATSWATLICGTEGFMVTYSTNFGNGSGRHTVCLFRPTGRRHNTPSRPIWAGAG